MCPEFMKDMKQLFLVIVSWECNQFLWSFGHCSPGIFILYLFFLVWVPQINDYTVEKYPIPNKGKATCLEIPWIFISLCHLKIETI